MTGRTRIRQLLAVQGAEFQKGDKVRMEMWQWDEPKEGVVTKVVKSPREFVFYLDIDGKQVGAFEKELTKI